MGYLYFSFVPGKQSPAILPMVYLYIIILEAAWPCGGAGFVIRRFRVQIVLPATRCLDLCFVKTLRPFRNNIQTAVTNMTNQRVLQKNFY